LNILTKFFKSRDKPKPKNLSLSSNEGWILSGGTSSGKQVNEKTAMQISTVYACVKILAESIASLPLHVFTKTENGGKEPAVTHALYTLLHDAPNPEMTSFTLRETMMAHLLLWGNAYAQIIRNNRGQAVSLYPLNPTEIEVRRDDNKELIYVYWSGSEYKTLKRGEVLHIPGLGFDGLKGHSPITTMRNALGIAIATEEYGAKFFANGARPGGVLEHPGVLKDAEKIRKTWNETFKGSENSNKIAVLEEGLKYHAIGVPPEDAQFLETRKFQTNEIARIFRVPPHMIGDLERSSFSNIEQQSLEFVKYTLNPWIVRWEQSLRQSLILPSEKPKIFIMFNLDGLLRGDYRSRIDGYTKGIQNGFYSVNDVRKLEDMSLLSDEDGGNLHFVNGNVVKLGEAGSAYENNQSGGEKD